MMFRILLCFAVLILGACGPTYTTSVLDTPETRELKGYEKPYMVNGKRYDPLRSHEGFVQEGLASWYGEKFHGRKTSNGEVYDMHAMTAAHKTLPLGIYVRVRNRDNGREAVVRLNDRGPFVKSRVIDLSYAAAKKLGVDGPGTAPVRVEALGYKKTDGGGEVTYKQPDSYRVGTFSIQVGAFAVEDNARRLASQLRGRHGAATVNKGRVDGRIFYRVRAGRYRTLEEAETARRRFARNGYAGGFVVATE
ncbi:MAG: septal ring lytic transglycosylase RlpA family protein [Desulfuromonadales bacterium]